MFDYTKSVEIDMTSSEVKYIIALYELSAIDKSIKQINLAHKLGLTRASIFKAIKNLSYKKYVIKESNSQVKLTTKGKDVATKYIACADQIKIHLIKYLKSEENEAIIDSLAITCVMNMVNINKLYKISVKKGRYICH